MFTASAAMVGMSPLLRDHPEALSLWFDALTFLFSAWMVSGLRLGRGERTADGRARGGALVEFREGLAFIRGQRTVKVLTIGLTLAFAAVGAVTAVGPLLATYALDSGEAGFGLFVTATGVGALLGMAAIAPVTRRFEEVNSFTWAIATAGFALALTAVAPTILWAAAAALPLGMSAGVSWVVGMTLLQKSVPDHLRGRTFAVLTATARAAVLTSRAAFPAVVVGIADLTPSSFGPRAALLIAAAMTAATAWFSNRLRRSSG